jgi:Smg protein
MFEVLAFVYDHHSSAEARLQPTRLERHLRSVGFDMQDIGEAMDWLQGLELATQPVSADPWLVQPGTSSMRIYPRHEQIHLGRLAVGYLHFLEQAGVLAPHLREVVIERAMAAPGGPVALDELKLIVLLVLRSFGQEPDALVFEELCGGQSPASAH